MAEQQERPQELPSQSPDVSFLDDEVATKGPREKIGTRNDFRDMARMGKLQELKV
jgi:hypothetical protein